MSPIGVCELPKRAMTSRRDEISPVAASGGVASAAVTKMRSSGRRGGSRSHFRRACALSDAKGGLPLAIRQSARRRSAKLPRARPLATTDALARHGVHQGIGQHRQAEPRAFSGGSRVRGGNADPHPTPAAGLGLHGRSGGALQRHLTLRPSTAGTARDTRGFTKLGDGRRLAQPQRRHDPWGRHEQGHHLRYSNANR